MSDPVKIAAVTLVGAAALLAACFAAGARINTTASFPIGLYWTAAGEPAQKGSLVLFCPPDNAVFAEARNRGYIDIGFCSGGYGYLIKKVLAVAGDRVAVTAAGVAVNNQLLPNSVPIAADPAGRPLPATYGAYSLRAGDVLLMSDYSKTSFDARYFGPVPAAAIATVIHPVFTW